LSAAAFVGSFGFGLSLGLSHGLSFGFSFENFLLRLMELLLIELLLMEPLLVEFLLEFPFPDLLVRFGRLA
jgi:hypothetical protein